MKTISHLFLSQEMNSNTGQSGERPGESGSITRSDITTQKSILRHVDSKRFISEQSGKGPSQLGDKGVKRKLSVKTIDTKYRAIMEVEEGEKSKSTIAKDLCLPLNTLFTWLKKKKQSIINAYQQFSQREKNTKTYTFNDVERANPTWFKSARDKTIPISCPILTTKAEEFAEKLDITNFKASVSWLEHFKSWQGISFKRVCGEEKSVDTQSVDMILWNVNLPNILQIYSPDSTYRRNRDILQDATRQHHGV